MESLAVNIKQTERNEGVMEVKVLFLNEEGTNKSKPYMMTNQDLVNLRSLVSGIRCIIKRDFILIES